MNDQQRLWLGRLMSGLFVLFMLAASIGPKLMGAAVVEETLQQLGWPAGYGLLIGAIELLCVLLYLWPRSSIHGAILTMALFGGAMATQIRAEMPLFSHILFSVYLAVLMWGGLWLRSARLRQLLSLKPAL
ncbi:DoxX family protein [Rheinheimera oceanensis]|uniref:DoxX family protein n=1 Tax=Rheinheimera oceanensis TaxID=2817449 RepID=UPI001BFDDA23|nr:DoxX family protein [Rheinheimera oceanensis]